MSRHVIIYVSTWCYNSREAQDALREWGVQFTAINIKQDREAAQRVRQWTGFESAPTLVLAEEDSLEPYEPPAPLAPGASPRGIDRGSMLTEPNRNQLLAWLRKHGLVGESQPQSSARR